MLFTHINRLNVNNAIFKYFMFVILDPPISHQSANITRYVTPVVRSNIYMYNINIPYKY